MNEYERKVRQLVFIVYQGGTILSNDAFEKDHYIDAMNRISNEYKLIPKHE